MLQAFGATLGMAFMAYIFTKLDRRQRIIASAVCVALSAALIVWAVLIIGR